MENLAMKTSKLAHVIMLTITFACQSFSQTIDTRGVNLIIKNSTGQTLTYYKNSYALVVGVSDYTNGWPDLPNAISDATKVGECLKGQGFKIESLFDPTKRELNKALEDFTFQYGQFEDTRLIFYFAGHGHSISMPYGKNLGYIVPADAPLPHQNKVAFMQKAISMQEFDKDARQIQAKHVLYIFDSCFSGSIFALSRSAPKPIDDYIKYHVRQFITAGKEDEEVPDESIFTKQLITALKGAGDIIKDGYITGSELGLYLQENVPPYSNQHPQFGKIRDIDLAKGDFVFKVHFNNFDPNSDQSPPIISDLTDGYAKEGMSFPVRVNVQDDNEVSHVVIVYKTGADSKPLKSKMEKIGNDIYEFKTPELTNHKFSYAVAAWDKAGNRNILNKKNIDVIHSDNNKNKDTQTTSSTTNDDDDEHKNDLMTQRPKYNSIRNSSSSGSNFLTYFSIGTGVIASGLGYYFYDQANQTYQDYEAATTSADAADLYDKTISLDNKSKIGFAVGGGLFAIGVISYLLKQGKAPVKQNNTFSLEPVGKPNFIGLGMSFCFNNPSRK